MTRPYKERRRGESTAYCTKRKTRFGTVDCWESGFCNPTKSLEMSCSLLRKPSTCPSATPCGWWWGVVHYPFSETCYIISLCHSSTQSNLHPSHGTAITQSDYIFTKTKSCCIYFFIHENPSGNSNDE